MIARPQPASSFPFLALPREVQAQVVRHVGDLAALRDLLAIPQVARSVAPFIRLITNRKKPLWFTGLEKYVKHIKAPEELPQLPWNSGGQIHILDLEYHEDFSAKAYECLKNPILAITAWDSEQEGYNPQGLKAELNIFARRIGVETMCIIGKDGSFTFDIEPSEPELVPNLTLVNMHCVQSSAPMFDLYGRYIYPPIRYVGSLSLFTLDAISKEDIDHKQTMLYDRYKELLHSAEEFKMNPRPESGYYDDDEGGQLCIDGWDFAQLRGQFQIEGCSQFCNVNINTGYTDDTSDMVRDGSLLLRLDPDKDEYSDDDDGYDDSSDDDSAIDWTSNKVDRPETFFVPVLENVVAPGLRKLTIDIKGPFFPLMNMLWLPDLQSLKLVGRPCENGAGIAFDHLHGKHIPELSKLLYVVQDLHLDQFMAPVLGIALPSALLNLATLTLEEHFSAGNMSPTDLEECARLVPKHGRVHMPKLKELHWISKCKTYERLLDFAQLSTWFNLGCLETLVFETVNEGVSLRDIGQQVPMIKELKIRHPSGDPFKDSPREKGIYPKPDVHLQYTSFERLERLHIETGYHPSIFSGITFPNLKHLQLVMPINALNPKQNIEAKMPGLEVMQITTSGKPQGASNIGIKGFENLRKLTVGTYAEVLRVTDCPLLEELTQKGGGLTGIHGMEGAWETLKVLRYRSKNGSACHRFPVAPSAEIVIRR